MRSRLNDRIASTALAIAFGFAAVPLAAQTISGAVQSGTTPLANVELRAEIRGVSRTAGVSGADGRFSINLANLFGRPVANGEEMVLIFSRDGFRQENRVQTVGLAIANPVNISLVTTGGATAVSPSDQVKLTPYKTSTGTGPLMLLPYQLSNGSPASNAAQLNERLRFNLERKIITYVQSAIGPSNAGVALKLLPVDGARDVDQLQAYGLFLNALAIVSGTGRSATGGGMFVNSSFVIIPSTASFHPPVAYVDDHLSTSQLDSPQLHQYLSARWGRITVLALAIRDINAIAPNPAGARKQALLRVRTYLATELGSAGPSNNEYVPELKALIAQLDKELRP